jgi:hypothetical protein
MKRNALPAVVAALSLLFAATALRSQANPLRCMQNAIVFLQKARMTAAVPAKSESLGKAKEQLVLAMYDRGGYRMAALAFIAQAEEKAVQLNNNGANQLIDMAILKVRHGIQAYKQEPAVRAASRSSR